MSKALFLLGFSAVIAVQFPAQAQTGTAGSVNSETVGVFTIETTESVNLPSAPFVVAEQGQVLTSKIIGEEIFDGPGRYAKQIGVVEDVVVSTNGRVLAALTTYGGVVGIGDKTIAISFDILDWRIDERGERRLIAALPPAQLEAAPAFSRRVLDFETINWKKRVSKPLKDTGLSITAILDIPVHGAEGRYIGTVAEVQLGKDGSVEALLVDVGGFFGLGSTPVALVYDTLTVSRVYPNADWQSIDTGLTKAELERLAKQKRTEATADRSTQRVRRIFKK